MMKNAANIARNVALAPYWAAQLLTGAKSFMDNPLLGNPGLNARGLHARRVQLAHRLAERRRAGLAHLVSAEDRTAFDRDGFVVRRDFLPPEQFAQVLAEVQGHRGTVRETRQGNAVTRRVALEPKTLRRLPALRSALRGAEWRGLLRYAGSYDAEPIFYLQTILTHALTGPDDPQCELHSDTFHPTVKAWLFLTDVAADAGPFTYVAGSHRLTPERLAWERRRSVAMVDEPDRLSRRGSLRVRADELAALGLGPARALAVPANTLVVADTYGFHARGPSAGPTQRVEVWAYGRRNPFLPWAGLDLWQVEALGQRRVPLFWFAQDVVERLTGKKGQWQARPDVSAFDADVLEA